MIIGWYYLHDNGDVIYKRELGGTAADIRESPFARAMWPLDPENREGAWTILIEAAALGANPDRIAELAEKWQCDDQDAAVFAERVGARLSVDGDQYCATRSDFTNIQESPAGYGKSALLAMAELCRALGYRGGKMWNAGFADLLKHTNQATA